MHLEKNMINIILLFNITFRSELDTQCKKWRLRADAINDLAIFIELLLSIPWVRQFSLVVLSFSSCAKSIVGVAGGATRAALTQHQVFLY